MNDEPMPTGLEEEVDKELLEEDDLDQEADEIEVADDEEDTSQDDEEEE